MPRQEPAAPAADRNGADQPPFAKSLSSFGPPGSITPSSEVCSKILIFLMSRFPFLWACPGQAGDPAFSIQSNSRAGIRQLARENFIGEKFVRENFYDVLLVFPLARIAQFPLFCHSTNQGIHMNEKKRLFWAGLLVGGVVSFSIANIPAQRRRRWSGHARGWKIVVTRYKGYQPGSGSGDRRRCAGQGDRNQY